MQSAGILPLQLELVKAVHSAVIWVFLKDMELLLLSIHCLLHRLLVLSLRAILPWSRSQLQSHGLKLEVLQFVLLYGPDAVSVAFPISTKVFCYCYKGRWSLTWGWCSFVSDYFPSSQCASLKAWLQMKCDVVQVEVYTFYPWTKWALKWTGSMVMI